MLAIFSLYFGMLPGHALILVKLGTRKKRKKRKNCFWDMTCKCMAFTWPWWEMGMVWKYVPTEQVVVETTIFSIKSVTVLVKCVYYLYCITWMFEMNFSYVERIMYQIIENPQIACSPCNLYYQYLYKVPVLGVELFCCFLFQVQWFWCWWGAGSKVFEPEIQCFLTSCVNSFWVASAGSSSEKCIHLLLPQRLFKDNFSMLCQFIS